MPTTIRVRDKLFKNHTIELTTEIRRAAQGIHSTKESLSRLKGMGLTTYEKAQDDPHARTNYNIIKEELRRQKMPDSDSFAEAVQEEAARALNLEIRLF